MNFWLRRIVAAAKERHEEIPLGKEDLQLLVEIREAYSKHLREKALEEKQQKLLTPKPLREDIHFASDEGEEEPKKSGPPKFWDEFLEERYEGGKALVDNTNKKTRDRFTKVRVTTLMKTDKGFMKQLMEEYRKWLGERNESKSTGTVKPVFGVKFPKDYHVEKHIKLDQETTEYLKRTRKQLKDVLDATGLAALEDIAYEKPIVRMNKGKLEVETQADELELVRQFDFEKGVVKNDFIKLHPDLPPGFGTKILTSQIEKARQMGMKKMVCEAFRRDPKFVGYKVWPRLGYDGEIPVTETGLPSKFQRALSDAGHKQPWRIQQLFSLGKDAIDWWDEHGDTFEAEFDLDENSTSMRLFQAYVKKKGGYDALGVSSSA